jgi:hypothetical protein
VWSTLRWCVVRRRPSLPHGPPCSTIGAERLNFRVRNGAGCFPNALITETLWRCRYGPPSPSLTTPKGGQAGGVSTVSRETSQWTRSIFVGTSPRPISIGQLHTLLCFHIRPITQCSAGGLTRLSCGSLHLGACFPLRCFQRLSLPNVANQPCSWQNNWHTRGSSVPVLSY